MYYWKIRGDVIFPKLLQPCFRCHKDPYTIYLFYLPSHDILVVEAFLPRRMLCFQRKEDRSTLFIILSEATGHFLAATQNLPLISQRWSAQRSTPPPASSGYILLYKPKGVKYCSSEDVGGRGVTRWEEHPETKMDCRPEIVSSVENIH